MSLSSDNFMKAFDNVMGCIIAFLSGEKLYGHSRFLWPEIIIICILSTLQTYAEEIFTFNGVLALLVTYHITKK